MLYNNYIEIATYILESGWINKKTEYVDKIDDSYYSNFIYIPNYEPMLDLLLEHNVSGQPSKEMIKKVYGECYNRYTSSIISAYDVENKKYFMKYETLHRNLYQNIALIKTVSLKISKNLLVF